MQKHKARTFFSNEESHSSADLFHKKKTFPDNLYKITFRFPEKDFSHFGSSIHLL